MNAEHSGHPETLAMPAGRWIDLPPDAQYGWLAALGSAIARAAACNQVTLLENPDGTPVAMISPAPADPAARYIARFTPEAWIRDNAVEVDAEGEQEWDCTAFALKYLDYLIRTEQGFDEDLGYGLGVLDTDDVFKDDPDAPPWVREWSGPFTIRIRREVRP